MAKKGNHGSAGEEAIPAVLRIDTGEKIVGGWITAEIPGVGMYKLLAKSKRDGTCVWVHFIQRSTGRKEKFVGGTVRNEKEVELVLAALNRSLEKVYGPKYRLQAAGTAVSTVDALNFGSGSIN